MDNLMIRALMLGIIGTVLFSGILIGISLVMPSEYIQVDDVSIQPTVRILEPVTRTIESTSTEISSQEFLADVKIESIPPAFSAQNNDLFAKAYAISPTQSSITVKTWTGALGTSLAFDSSRNHFSSQNNEREIAFIDIFDNTKKTWVLPNDNRQHTNRDKMGVDSSGNLYFGQFDANGNFPKLVRLNPSTNVLTEFDIGISNVITHVIVTPSDEIFFVDVDGGVKKLDITQNKVFVLGESVLGQFLDFETDFTGNFYGNDFSGKIFRINVDTNTLTIWSVSPNKVWSVNTDSSGKIFFTESDGTRSKVGRIAPDNTLTEWVIPNSGERFIRDIGVDSTGNVFFTFNGLTRLVPSTGVFTEFSVSCELFEIDSLDDIYCSEGSIFSKIT